MVLILLTPVTGTGSLSDFIFGLVIYGAININFFLCYSIFFSSAKLCSYTGGLLLIILSSLSYWLSSFSEQYNFNIHYINKFRSSHYLSLLIPQSVVFVPKDYKLLLAASCFVLFYAFLYIIINTVTNTNIVSMMFV